jgi:hypothetical protein
MRLSHRSLLAALLPTLLLACNLFTELESPSDEALDAAQDLSISELPVADLAVNDLPVSMDMTPDLALDMAADMPGDLADAAPDDMPEELGQDMPVDMSTGPSSRLVAVPARAALNRLAYYEYMPSEPPAPGSAPLIIWLHDEQASGVGGLERLHDQALIRAIREDQWSDQDPAVVLAPRLADGRCLSAFYLADFIGFALNHYPGLDASRVHVIGAGCGASAAWDYLASAYTNPITSATLIGGDGAQAWAGAGCALRQRAAIWALYGDADAGSDAGDQLLMDLGACALPEQAPLRGEVRAGRTGAQIAGELVDGSWPQQPEPGLWEWQGAQVRSVARPAQGFSMSLPIGRRAFVDVGTNTSPTMQAGWSTLSSCQQLDGSVGLEDDAGAPTLGVIRVSDVFDGANAQGTMDAQAPYPLSAASDGCYAGNANLQVARQASAGLVLTELEPGADYDVTVYASRIDPNGGAREGRYTIGGVSGSLEATGNVSARLVLQSVRADAQGTLTLGVRVAQGNNLYAYVNVVEVLAR